MLDQDTARERVLAAAEELFYGRGIQAVGMDAVRAASGVSLKRLYQMFPSKEDLVVSFLQQRDSRWLRNLAATVETHADPGDRIPAVFDWLHTWFSEPGYRGCAFINSFGELGGISPAVAEQARHHKREFHAYLAGLVDAAGHPAELAEHLALLAEGAIVNSAIFGTPEPATRARRAALALMRN
ncbi:TetR/AcrR family transcriptional regulator [Mycolicibacterium goodii]|uniref:TetR/AcrR family transcriptional regulator n=1 Tax=Mycolicibacterium goodii TaxID=134601 RepID=UPI000C266AD7|nr:TetR/AcrR family transcriptional regulator [Mycolicibacterium goodii]PJK23687.1 TetR family transcriptional regulator [Mycolicibacterium goodii]